MAHEGLAKLEPWAIAQQGVLLGDLWPTPKTVCLLKKKRDPNILEQSQTH